MKNKIQELILNRNLKDRVFLRGQVDRNQLMEEILAADVAVFPSLREAQPVSVLEAMALEKPVVVFDYSFAREIVRDQDTGFLARPKDSKDLAAKIGSLLSDRRLRDRIGQNACEYVIKHHNWDVLIRKYIALYDEVADKMKLRALC